MLLVYCEEEVPGKVIGLKSEHTLLNLLERFGSSWLPQAEQSTNGDRLQTHAAALAAEVVGHTLFIQHRNQLIAQYKDKAEWQKEWQGKWILDSVPLWAMRNTAEVRIAWWAAGYNKQVN